MLTVDYYFRLLYSMVRCGNGMAWHGMVCYDMIWYGIVCYDMLWHGMVWYGGADEKSMR